MLSFKNFLVESSRTKNIDLTYAAKYVALNCMQAFNNSNSIYRGADNSNRIAMLFDSSLSKPRKSSNTTNYYNAIISDSPHWREYPRRDKSIICSSSYKTASEFGDLFAVFPEDSAMMGVCPALDLWYSFSIVMDFFGQSYIGDNTMDNFNEFIELSLIPFFEAVGAKRLKGVKNIRSDKSAENIKKQFDFIDSVLGTFSSFEEFKDKTDEMVFDYQYEDLIFKFVEKAISTKSSFGVLEELFDPVQNKFKLISIDDFDEKVMHDNEVWISAKSILISTDRIDEFRETVNEILV